MLEPSTEKQTPDDAKSPIKAVSSRIAWTSPWYRVRQDKVLLPDGSPGVFNIVEHSGAVWIIPVTREGKVVLLRHYRYSVDDWCWEIPAGGIKDGLSMEETALAELKEEVGGTASELIYIGQFYTSNGISNEVAHIFLALGVELGETDHEPAEVIEIHLKPLDEIMEMAHHNEISDGPSALALFLCEERLRHRILLT
ncbi:MAG TPA: NUDIX hydrolase [candidate division Zixibacteria bacterium]|nr:NUDIX hydrolase [candidate division Zixibacteria bacterium]